MKRFSEGRHGAFSGLRLRTGAHDAVAADKDARPRMIGNADGRVGSVPFGRYVAAYDTDPKTGPSCAVTSEPFTPSSTSTRVSAVVPTKTGQGRFWKAAQTRRSGRGSVASEQALSAPSLRLSVGVGPVVCPAILP